MRDRDFRLFATVCFAHNLRSNEMCHISNVNQTDDIRNDNNMWNCAVSITDPKHQKHIGIKFCKNFMPNRISHFKFDELMNS